MKFSCDQQTLSKALTIVSKAVTSRTTVPILKGILLEVKEDGTLKLSASDLDISIQNTIEVEDAEAGTVIVMAKLFNDIIRKLPSGTIHIESDEEYNVNIRCNHSDFRIVGMSPDEFPVLQSMDANSTEITFNKADFRSMIDRTSFAASIDESRGIITGVLVEMNEDSLNMVAIDGYRMAINRMPQGYDKAKHFVISAKIFSEISRIINDINSESETGTLFLSDKKVGFILDEVKIDVKLMEGEFIRYQDILPKQNAIEVVLSRADLKESIERASLMTKAAKNNLIRVNIEDNLVTITSNSDEGNVKEEIEVTQSGDNLTIGFNAQYLLDVLKQIKDEEIKMMFNTPVTPCLIHPIEGNEYEYLVLPVRIN